MSTAAEIEKLLTEVNGIIEKHKKVDEMTGKKFNIFKVCEIDEKEVLICRFIYQLINPKGQHNQGDVFLRKFITDVLGGVISDSGDSTNNNNLIITKNELSNVRVFKEFVINNNRRIDLLIETNEHTIPIEVKIFASDQENQCNDYLKYSKNSKLYYLTLFGDPPSDYSYNYNNIKEKSVNFEDELDQKIEDIKNDIYCISFRDYIVPWIEDCIKDINIIDKKQIVDNLMQFLTAVRGLCNMGDNELNRNLNEILEKPKNFEAYIEMTKCQSKVTSKVLETIFTKLNEWAKEKYATYLVDPVYENCRSDEINTLCNGGRVGNNVPGFGILCKKAICGCNLSVVVETSKAYDIYCGIYIKDEEKQNNNNTRAIYEKLRLNGPNRSNIWVTWDYINIGSIGSPNFVKPNEAFAKLLNDETLDQFIEEVEQKLKELIDKVEEN